MQYANHSQPSISFHFLDSDRCDSCYVHDSLDHIIFHCTEYQLHKTLSWQPADINIRYLNNFLIGFMDKFDAQ